MSAAHRGAYTPPDGAFRQAAGAAGLDLLAPMAAQQSDARPLLILDAGAFQAQCRACGWTSTRQPTLGAAWAEFEAHECRGRPA